MANKHATLRAKIQATETILAQVRAMRFSPDRQVAQAFSEHELRLQEQLKELLAERERRQRKRLGRKQWREDHPGA